MYSANFPTVLETFEIQLRFSRGLFVQIYFYTNLTSMKERFIVIDYRI